MKNPISNQEISDASDLLYRESISATEDKSSSISPSLSFFKVLWKARFREKQFFIMYLIGIGISIALIAIDTTSQNTIDEDKNPVYTYFNDPYVLFYAQVINNNYLLTMAPKNSDLVNMINNVFHYFTNISFELKSSTMEMKNYLNSKDKNGIGAYLNETKNANSKSKYEISLMKKSSPEYVNLAFYLSIVQFIMQKDMTHNNNIISNFIQSDEFLRFQMKERPSLIQFPPNITNNFSQNFNVIKDVNDDDNSSFLFNISSKSYSHPKMRPVFGYEAQTSFYVILAYYYIAIASSTLIFKYNKEKVLFYLNIHGLGVLKMYFILVLCSLLEYVPITIIVSIAITFISKSLRGSNFLIVLITTILMAIGRTFFAYISLVIFLNFSNPGVHYLLTILIPVVFMLLSMFKSKLPDILFYILSGISPTESYMMSFAVMTACKEKSGSPITFSLMNTKFNGMKMSEVLGLQVCNTVLMLLLMILFMLNMNRLYGHALIGWKNMFKKNYWMRLCNKKSKIVNNHTETNSVIKLENIEKTYKGHVETKALNGVNCDIQLNEKIVLIGPNGSGKSTIIDCIIGTIPFDSGNFEFFGENLDGNYTYVYDNLGIVFQDNVLINELTVNEHFELIGSLHLFSKSKIENYSNYLLSLLSLSDCKKNRASNLSGGQKRKLCIALALIHQPPLLIFDEPTAGVDPQSRQVIWKAISTFNETTSLITTHALEEAESICSRLFIMVKGKISFMGTPSELRIEAGCGYILTVVEENPEKGINVRDNLLSFIQNRIPEAKALEGKDKSIMFPTDLRVADLLEEIDNSKEDLGIVKYTLNIQNLEESLVKLIQNEEVNQMKF